MWRVLATNGERNIVKKFTFSKIFYSSTPKMARLKIPRPDFLVRMVKLGHIERSKVGVNIFCADFWPQNGDV